MSASFLAITGYLTGLYTQRTDVRPYQAVLTLVVSGMATVALASGHAYIIPVIKSMWTPSFNLFALGWAFALSAATNLPLWGYFIVAAYLSWHGLFIGGSLAGTPLFALPTVWMLLIGWRLARMRHGRWCFWFLSMCFGAAYLTYGAFGLRKIFTGDWELFAPITLSLLYFAALTNRFVLKRFSLRPEESVSSQEAKPQRFLYPLPLCGFA